MSKHLIQMIMTILSVLLLCGCGAKDHSTISMDYYPDTDGQTSEQSGEQEDVLTELPQAEDTLYVVISIDTKKRLIGLALPDSPRTIQYGYTKSTKILDEYGQFMSAGRLEPGRVVTLGELDDEAKLTEIR